MQVTIQPKTLEIKEAVDVLVVGGGPAGIGAALSAARNGARTMLLEKRGFLGGNITACYMENCNYFMEGTGLDAEGIFHELEQTYFEKYGNEDLRGDQPRINSELFKVHLDDAVREAGVRLKLHAFVNEVAVEKGRIVAAVIQTKKGPVAVGADVVIDTTGDADVAFSAGVPYEQGRERDGLCQPGTVNLRLAGADTERLLELTREHGTDILREYWNRYREQFQAGKTGLVCRRQDIPMGRLTRGGQIGSVNYPCEYKIDPCDVDDLTRGEVNCRGYALDIVQYLREHFEGLENVEISTIGPEIGFRDSRRIVGEYCLTYEDTRDNRSFDDVIAVYPAFYDMLCPDPDKITCGDGSVEARGYNGHIYEPVRDGKTFQVPYRSLLPGSGPDNLLVAGRCLSADHVAESAVRAISLCMMTGEAAGAAAALAARSGAGVKNIDIRALQAMLRQQGFSLPAANG